MRARIRRKSRAAVMAVPGIVALAGMGLMAPPAAADTIADTAAYIEGITVQYTGGDVTNDVTVTIDNPWEEYTEFTIDDTVPIVAGNGCEHPDASDTTLVVCVSYYAEPEMNIALGGGNDAYSVSGPFTELGTVYGGPGDDRIAAGGEVHGDEGNDVIFGNGWGNRLYGGYGSDLVEAGDGDDEVYGGLGHDDVLAGEGDDVVYGNSGQDEIRGGEGGDQLSGGPDPDVIYGNSGDDHIRGGPGEDDLSGGPGRDDVAQ